MSNNERILLMKTGQALSTEDAIVLVRELTTEQLRRTRLYKILLIPIF